MTIQSTVVGLMRSQGLGHLLRYAPWPVWAGAGLAGGVGIGLLIASLIKPGDAAAAEPPTGPVQPGGAPPVISKAKNSSGPWVTFLQQKLGIAATGSFDETTDAAVRTFQGQHNLAVDGVVGKNTWSALGVSTMPAPKPPGGKPAGQKGSTPEFLGASDAFGLSEDIGEREQQILTFVQQGAVDHDWWPLEWVSKGRTARIAVSRRALAIESGDARLIVNCTMPTMVKIGDAIGGVPLTTRMSDEIVTQANLKLPVMSKNWQGTGTDNSGSKTFRMYDQSASIDSQISGVAGGMLIANEGKDWVLTRRFWLPPQGTGETSKLHRPANFGWYPGGSKSPGGMSVVQSVGLAHDMGHTDYSQLVRFCDPTSVRVDGQAMLLADALADPAISYLFNDEGGTLPGIRHPDL